MLGGPNVPGNILTGDEKYCILLGFHFLQTHFITRNTNYSCEMVQCLFLWNCTTFFKTKACPFSLVSQKMSFVSENKHFSGNLKKIMFIFQMSDPCPLGFGKPDMYTGTQIHNYFFRTWRLHLKGLSNQIFGVFLACMSVYVGWGWNRYLYLFLNFSSAPFIFYR